MDILCIEQLLRAQAEGRPGAIALAAPGRRRLSYGRLWTQVAGMMGTLSAMGVKRNDRVAIVLPNGPEMAVAFLSVAACAIAAPLNPAYREKEFDFYLTDLDAKALIVASDIDSPARSVAEARNIPLLELSSVPETEAGVFTLAGGEERPALYDDGATPEDAALVLHTSGTTSRPKLVSLTQKNLCASAYHVQSCLELTEKDRCLNVMPLFHVHGLIGSVLASLAAGASVVCASDFDAQEFFSWLDEFRPTWYTAVPAFHQAVLSCAQTDGKSRERHSLRFIRSCSAALPPGLMRELEQAFNVAVIEAYGMTEAAHQIASNPLPPRKRKQGSVGLPAGSEVSITDERGALQPAGKIGEIVIRGPNVASGYAKSPEGNLESFADGWFRTGDQGYLDSDGYLFITGRLKEIINKGGEKISPREVDEIFLQHPAVTEAVSFAVPHPTLGEDLAVAIVVRDKARTAEPQLRQYLRDKMADFKIPSEIWIVDEIPKGPTGKIQRNQLAQRLAPEAKKQVAPATTKLAAAVASIYSEVLGIPNVVLTDNFFALGGDSLRGTQVLSRIRAAFQVNLSIGTLFSKATVAALAEEIGQATRAPDLTPIMRTPRN